MNQQLVQGPSVTVTHRFSSEEDKQLFLIFCTLTSKSPKDIFSDFVSNVVETMKKQNPQSLELVSRLRFLEIASDPKNTNIAFKFLAQQLDKHNPVYKVFVNYDNVLMLLNYVSFDADAMKSFFEIVAKEYSD